MGFVGNYAPCGLSPQTDGMPVIQMEPGGFNTPPDSVFPSNYISSRLRCFITHGSVETKDLPPGSGMAQPRHNPAQTQPNQGIAQPFSINFFPRAP